MQQNHRTLPVFLIPATQLTDIVPFYLWTPHVLLLPEIPRYVATLRSIVRMFIYFIDFYCSTMLDTVLLLFIDLQVWLRHEGEKSDRQR